jgi:hypothetical protein
MSTSESTSQSSSSGSVQATTSVSRGEMSPGSISLDHGTQPDMPESSQMVGKTSQTKVPPNMVQTGDATIAARK